MGPCFFGSERCFVDFSKVCIAKVDWNISIFIKVFGNLACDLKNGKKSSSNKIYGQRLLTEFHRGALRFFFPRGIYCVFAVEEKSLEGIFSTRIPTPSKFPFDIPYPLEIFPESRPDNGWLIMCKEFLYVRMTFRMPAPNFPPIATPHRIFHPLLRDIGRRLTGHEYIYCLETRDPINGLR